MTAQQVVALANLGADFDIGSQVTSKLNIVAATTTAPGKVTLAASSDVTAGTAGKVVDAAQLKAAVSGIAGGMQYQGAWNASTNSPALTSGTGTKGYFYKVSTAGATMLDGCSVWNVGDMALFDGATWDKLEGPAEAVTSVAGRTGAVAIASGDVSGFSTAAASAATAAATVNVQDAFGNHLFYALP